MRLKKLYPFTLIICILFVFFTHSSAIAQQDPHFTQYMYFTQVINPGYIGSREDVNFGGLYRAQWVGIEGAPRTLTLIGSTPLSEKVGLGMSIVRDEIGPARQSYAHFDFSYKIDVTDDSQLAFGIKAGGSILDVDFTRLNIYDSDDSFEYNIDNRFSPQIGAGVYYFRERFFFSYSIPNFLETEHFDNTSFQGQNISSSVAKDRMHHYIMAGYTFDLTHQIQFRPVVLTKFVSGAPLQIDISTNYIIFDKFLAGLAYRWSAAFSAMVGFYVTDSLLLGLAYDVDTSRMLAYNKGSYEFFLRYEIFNNICCP